MIFYTLKVIAFQLFYQLPNLLKFIYSLSPGEVTGSDQASAGAGLWGRRGQSRRHAVHLPGRPVGASATAHGGGPTDLT